MKHSARLALTLLAATLTASALAAAQVVVTPPATTAALPNKVRTVRPIFTTVLPGVTTPLVLPTARACAPIREVPLSSGVSTLTLAPVAPNACAPAAPIARGSTAQETLRLRVSARAAVMLSSTGGALTLFNEQGTATPLQTSVGACGAGLHEELVFRAGLFHGGALLLAKVSRRPRAAWLVAGLVTSVVFAAMHYLGPLGDRFSASSFVFRLLLGAVFALLYRTRGIAVAAWTHALYDILYFALRRL